MSNEPFQIDPAAVYRDGHVRIGLGLTDAAVTRARREGRLRYTRQGKVVLYRGAWLLDWLEGDATPRPERKGVRNA